MGFPISLLIRFISQNLRWGSEVRLRPSCRWADVRGKEEDKGGSREREKDKEGGQSRPPLSSFAKVQQSNRLSFQTRKPMRRDTKQLLIPHRSLPKVQFTGALFSGNMKGREWASPSAPPGLTQRVGHHLPTLHRQLVSIWWVSVGQACTPSIYSCFLFFHIRW